MGFSVLMSLYNGEKAGFLDLCLKSLHEQTLVPDQIVIVFDGPIHNSLIEVISKWEATLNITRVVLTVNSGLGVALNSGLKYCNNEIICRMDTDDVCRTDRCEKLVTMLQNDNNLALVGSYIAEFDFEPLSHHAIKKVPISYDEIIKYAKKRNPFNHMSVAFRKSCVISCGGYQNEFLYEDYALWVRVLSSGNKAYNIPEPLVYARVGNDMELKRGGIKYAASEIKAQYGFYKSGFISGIELFRNLILRLPIRLIPNSLRRIIYRRCLRN
jgi:glycosyltransferase involved in cell wall biosynthesis